MSADELRGAGGARVAAQAKVNLRLRILAREAGGYHQLETLFLRLALADTVRVRRTGGARSLDASGLADPATIGPAEKNLAWRAADAYLMAARLPGGFAIELEKRIPIGGGLGGGSADAGAVLRALDAISPNPLGEATLLRLAATLGADVPFLASSHAYALAWGRGERMLPLSPPAEREVLLIVPPFAVRTADAYAWLAESRASAPEHTPAGILDRDSLSDWRALDALAVNEFEPVVAARHPEIATIVRGLRTFGCSPAMMSGSGSVVFGVVAADAPPGGFLMGEPFVATVTTTATRVEPVLPLD